MDERKHAPAPLCAPHAALAPPRRGAAAILRRFWTLCRAPAGPGCRPALHWGWRSRDLAQIHHRRHSERAGGGRSRRRARTHSCGSSGASTLEIRASGRRARPAPWSRGGRRWKGLRRLRAAPARPPPRRRPRCARAPAWTAGPRCASPTGGTPAAMRCAGGTAAEAPETRRAGLGDSFPNLARCRQRTGGSLGRVLNVRGRPAVCKRRLVAAARGPQTTPGGAGRLRTNGAAVWQARGQFGTAVAACGRGGRTAASGGKRICVCRRIRFPFLVFRTRAGSPRDIFLPQAKSASSQRITPPAQGRLPPPSAQSSAPASRSERVL